MKRRVCLIAMCLALSGWAGYAQDPYRLLVQLTIAGSASGFTSTVIGSGSNNTTGHPQANWATCRVRTAEISFTTDGTTPTSTVGVLAEPGDILDLKSNLELRLFLAIRTTGTSGQVDCIIGS